MRAHFDLHNHLMALLPSLMRCSAVRGLDRQSGAVDDIESGNHDGQGRKDQGRPDH